MIIVGEKLNSSIKTIRPAMEERNRDQVADLAKLQAEAGADYIDINAGMFLDKEPDVLNWLAEVVQDSVDKPICIDSPNPLAIEQALRVNKNGKPLVNSITAEKERWEQVLPLVLQYKTAVIALCMDDEGMPETAEDRFRIAAKMIDQMTSRGMALEDIFIDPMIRPVGTGTHYALVALETLCKVKQAYPGVHTICGLSNISFGLPARKVINQAFLVMAINSGLDGAILDPLDKKLMSLLYAAEVLQNRDEYCQRFIAAFRQGKLEG